MEQQTYEITAPNGRVLSITGDHVPTEAELRQIFSAAGVATQKPLPSVSARAGVPAAGRGTQLDLDKSQRGVDLATTPLARPTGIDAIDSFTSPLGLAALAAGGAGIARAGIQGGVAAAVKAAASEASPVIKYEVARRSMTTIGIPDAVASPIAMVIAGYKKGAKPEAVGPVDPAAPHLDRSVPMQPGPMTQEQIAERLKFGTGTPPAKVEKPPLGSRLATSPVESAVGGTAPPADPLPSPTPAAPPPDSILSDQAVAARKAAPSNNYPDQKALNEEALARRRAEYQARPAAPPAPTKPTMTAAESKVYLQLRVAGKTDQEAKDLIQASRALNDRLSLSSPTPADTKFPKGMRGKAPTS